MFMRYNKQDGGRSQYFKGKTGDCVIRSISIALSQDYMETYNDLFDLAKSIGYLPNDTKVYKKYLKSKGWVQNKCKYKPNSKRRYTLNEWAMLSSRSMPEERMPLRCLISTSGHLTAVVDGILRDSWDCSDWCAGVYYTPTEEWYKQKDQKRKSLTYPRKVA